MKSLSISLILSLLLLFVTGCRATVPGAVHRTAVNWVKHHVTVGGRNEKNLLTATKQNIEDGKQAFDSYCMVCHGLDGQNTGVPFAATMSPPVPSLASAEVQAYTDGQLKDIIQNGIYPSGMPPSKDEFSDEDIWRMVLYIRNLPKAGSLGEPAVYGGSAK